MTQCDTDAQISNIIHIKKKVRIYKNKKKKSKNHIRDTNSTNIFMCDICDYQGTRKSLLRDHVKVHEVKEKVPCQICGKLIFEHRRRHHNYRCHNEERQKMVQCTVCGKEFQKRQLLKHMKS